MIVFRALVEMATFGITTILIVLLLNYLFVKDFKKLIGKIKRVILNSQQTHKITQIKQLVYKYFFVD